MPATRQSTFHRNCACTETPIPIPIPHKQVASLHQNNLEVDRLVITRQRSFLEG